ncbi:MAG TPA: carboxylesterase family protein [Candidatus Binatia bacterium]|nr:carboxylesterase family protein [Candidatus Binatia bacterium]
MRTGLPLVVWLGLLVACGARAPERHAPDPALRRTTTSGDVVGFVGPYGNAAWLGIPYAAPPVGSMRWRAPAPPARWDGVREAVAFGSPCVQYASSFGGMEDLPRGAPAGSEDCLFLNVYTPRTATPGSARLPVMMWIHGGGNTVGHAGFFDGGNVAARENVVVVTINYRLGPFGWFRHAALRNAGASDLDGSGNFGTLDQVRALEWVRDNATAFGGDPENVTIFGESAGGQNVFALLLAPPARGLFHRAIVESGGLDFRTTETAEGFTDDPQPGHPNSSGEAAARMLVTSGAVADRAAARVKLAAMSPEETAVFLRSRAAFDVLRAFPPGASGDFIELPRVFRDGVVLPAGDPLEALGRSGAHAEVPVMVGTNRDENKLFMFSDPALVRRWFGIIPRLRDPVSYQVDAEYLARMWKATGADQPAATLSASQRAPVFVYRFDWDEEPTILGADLPLMLGAAHGFEIPFVFGHFDLGRQGSRIFTAGNAPGRETLSAQMMGYWAQFARTGDPGQGTDGTQPLWPRWDGTSRYLVLDTPAGGGVRTSTDGVTSASVVAAVDADARLRTQRDKCRVFRTLASWGRGFDRADYPTAGAHGCAQYPFDSFPWPD